MRPHARTPRCCPTTWFSCGRSARGMNDRPVNGCGESPSPAIPARPCRCCALISPSQRRWKAMPRRRALFGFLHGGSSRCATSPGMNGFPLFAKPAGPPLRSGRSYATLTPRGSLDFIAAERDPRVIHCRFGRWPVAHGAPLRPGGQLLQGFVCPSIALRTDQPNPF
jgi:hypothetical protein